MPRIVFLLSLVLTSGIAYSAHVVRTQVAKEFEVAAIKPRKSGALGTDGVLVGCHGRDTVYPQIGLPLTPPPLGRCIFKNTLKGLIKTAYRRDERLIADIVGGPEWVGKDEFDIEAKAENGRETEADLILMLRPLLTDRFKLRFHRELKEVEGVALVVAKNGPKLTPTTESSIEDMAKAAGKGGGIGGIYKNWTMRSLVDDLRFRLGVPVSDKTGLSGPFDFVLRTQSDPGLALRAGMDPALIEQLPNDAGPGIAKALEEQLGLKLLANQKIAMDVIVIDSAQKPEIQD